MTHCVRTVGSVRSSLLRPVPVIKKILTGSIVESIVTVVIFHYNMNEHLQMEDLKLLLIQLFDHQKTTAVKKNTKLSIPIVTRI